MEFRRECLNINSETSICKVKKSENLMGPFELLIIFILDYLVHITMFLNQIYQDHQSLSGKLMSLTNTEIKITLNQNF